MPRLRVLGPVGLIDADGRPVPLGGRERTLTAALALERGRAVPNDRLIDALWPARQPANALNVLRNVVLRLRKAIDGWESVRVEGAPHGYVLTCPDREVDAALAELLAVEARRAAADGDWERCVSMLDDAGSLFRGDAFSGYDELDGVLPERARIAELGLRIAEERVEGLLELGRTADAALSLEVLCPANPLRERPWLQHMVALHRLGRDGDALEVGRRYRDHLQSELGLDPSPEWHDLQQRILRQDPQLRRATTALPAGEITFLRAVLTDDQVPPSGEDWGGAALELVTAFAGAVTAHGGVVTERALDSLASAFPTPASALAASRAICRIAADRVGHGLEPRIGIHAGAGSTPVHGQYLTSEARLADRVAAAAHPGQVLVTGSAVVPSETGEDTGRLRHLGAFHLIGSDVPVDLWELANGLPGRQPRAVAALRHNLPTFSSDLIGREEERDEVVALVTAPGTVSLVGPGGVGKTRLAVEVALRRVERGNTAAVFVPLAPVANESMVDAAFADAFGLRASGPGLVSAIAHEVSSRDVLVVVDNCEHVTRRVAELILDLRRQSPRTSIMVTSREPLGVDGEVVWRLAPLDVPPAHTPSAAQPMIEYAAVRMFAARAHAADRSFALDDGNAGMVGDVVRALDGLPLALELAASLVGSLGLVELGRGLEYRLDLLDTPRAGVDPRHQVLRATLSWSHDLLSDRERLLYRRLAVFTAPVDVDAIEAVCADDALPVPLLRGALARLVERSLVMRKDDAQGARFSLLETMKVHAGAELESAAELEDVQRRHAGWVIEVAERVADDPVLADVERFDRVHALRGDIRAALMFLLEHEPGAALRLITGSRLMGDWMSRWGDAVELVDRALAGADDAALADRAAAFQIQGFTLLFHDLPAAARALRTASDLFAELGAADEQGISLQRLASATADLGDLEEARQIAEEAMAVKRRDGDPFLLAFGLQEVAAIANARGDWHEALRVLDRAIADFEAVQGPDVASLRWRSWKATILCRLARVTEARELAQFVLETYPTVAGAEPFNVYVHHAFARIALAEGDVMAAARQLADGIKDVAPNQRLRLGDQVREVATIACLVERFADSAVLHAGAASLDRSGGRVAPRGEAAQVEDELVRVRSELGPGRFHRAWRRGSLLGEDGCAAFALRFLAELTAKPLAPSLSGAAPRAGAQVPAG